MVENKYTKEISERLKEEVIKQRRLDHLTHHLANVQHQMSVMLLDSYIASVCPIEEDDNEDSQSHGYLAQQTRRSAEEAEEILDTVSKLTLKMDTTLGQSLQAGN